MPPAEHPTIDGLPIARVQFDDWVEFARFLMQQGGAEGLFIRVETPPPLGTELGVQLVLPDHTDVVLAARVVHRVTRETRGEEPGMGVQFTHMSEDQGRRLEALMANAKVVRGLHAAAAEERGEEPSERPPPVPRRARPPPVPIDPKLMEAIRLIDTSRFDAAAVMLERMISEKPGHRQARTWRAIALAREARSQFRFDEALAQYQQVLELDPENLEARDQVEALSREMDRSQELFDRVFGSLKPPP